MAVTAAAAAAPAVRRIGIRVTSGNMYAYPEGAWFWRTWWSGYLPASIPVPIFDSYKSEYAPYPTGPLYHAAGVDWTGTIKATSPTTVKIEGKFSMPNYQHGVGGVVITWYYGTFLFEGDLLWSTNLDGLDALDGTSFSSHLYFKSEKPLPISKYPVQSAPSSLQQFVADSAAIASGAVRIPVVLSGSYSVDRHTFMWSGDAVITVPEPRPLLQAKPGKPGKAIKDDGKPAKKDDTKPSKPVKPPKLRIAAMVLGGSVNATYDNSSSVELWSGAVPMWLPSAPFGVPSWDLDQTIKWSGALTALDKTGKMWQLDGTFEAPYFEQGTDGMVEHKWKGKYSLQLQNMYSAITAPQLLKPGKVMSSRVVFSMAKKSGTPPLMLQAGDGAGDNQAVIILQGQYWFWSKSWFWWNGMASVSVPLDGDVTDDPNQYVKPEYTKLKAAPGAVAKKAAPSTRLAVAVVEGKITAKKEDDTAPAATWWSGELPATIPSMPFDGDASAASTPFNRSAVTPGGVPRGVSWTGALRPLPGEDDAMLEGSFRFPKFLHPSAPGSSFALEWWTGQFSLRLRPLVGTSLSGVLTKTASYSSPLVFKAMSPDESIVSLLKQPAEQAGVGFVMASSAAADGAAKLPILLQGSYSPDGSGFMWTGNAILQVPSAAKLQRPLKLTASASKAAAPAGKPSPATVSKIGAVVTSGTVSAAKAGQAASTVWSGAFPASLPTGAAGPASVLWSGSLQQQSDAPATVSLTGTFSTALPEDDNGTVAWWSGDFSLQMQLLWNVSLAGCIRPGVKYVTPLYYRSASQKMQQGQQVASLSQELDSAGEKVLAFLDGSYSADQATFLWTGKVFLTLPKSCGKPAAPLKLQASAGTTAVAGAGSAGRLTLGGVVLSGWVTPSLWSGALPVAIPVAAIRSVRPLTWVGSLARGAGGSVTIKGSFSAPQYHHDAGTFSVDWVTGDFSFKARLLWDSGAALDSALSAGGNYTSAIYLQNSDSLRELEDVQDRVPAVWDRMVDKVAGPVAPAANKVPVVLQGEFAPDGATFWWSGGVLIALPAAA